MDSFKTILYSAVAFNLVVVILAIFLIIKTRIKQKRQAMIKRRQIIEQGKIIIAQESLLKSKQELLNEKDDLLGEYRKLI